MRKLIKYGFLIVSVLVALILLLSKIIPSINPFEQSSIGILAYVTPVFVLINIFFIFFWLSARKYYFILIPFFSLAFTWSIWSGLFASHFFASQDFSKGKGKFTVMSYNIRLLDLYKWSGKKDTRKKIIDFLKKQDADILCLQEFYTGNDSIGFDNISEIKYACGYPYASMCDVNVNKRGRWGSVVFSKQPIVKIINHDIDVVGSNKLQQVDINLQDDTISIFNIHLKSNKFSSQESQFVGKKELPDWNDTTISQTRNIYNKILSKTTSRGLEAQLVSNVIRQNNKKTIITGDLNDIASSYVYFEMRKNMKDAFLEKGNGLGATYVGAVPLLRIDYLFFSSQLNLIGFEKLDVDYTDHYPIKANFDLKNN